MESRHSADKPKENRCVSFLLLLVSTVSFSIQALLVRWLTQRGIGTFQLLLLRGSCQGLGCCLWLRGQPLETWLGTSLLEYQALFIRAVLGYCALCFCFMSISLIPFADALILGQTAPIFWQILGWGLLEEAWHVPDTVSASTALFGLGFLSKPPGPLSSFAIFRHFVGFLCGLLGCLSTGAAAETLVIHWVGRVKVSWPSVVLAQALGQLIISPFAFAVSGEPLRLFTQQQLGVALLLSLLGFASQIAQIKGMQQARIASASVIHYMLCPLLGLLYQHLVLPEELTWTSFAGYGFVSMAIVMSHLAKERRVQLAAPPAPKYSEVARSETRSEGEGSLAQSVECMGFNPQDASVYGKRSFFDEGPGQDWEDEMIEALQSDGFSRRQAELALAEVQWSSREEALDVLLDVKFQLSSNGKPLEPSGAESAALHRPLRTVEEANEAGEDT